MNKPDYPSAELVASIRHEAEKLGYLVAQVEENFAERATYERRQVLVRHGMENSRVMRQWLDNKINDEAMANLSAEIAERTSDELDTIKMNFTCAMNDLNQMVLHHVTNGRDQQDELDDFLDRLLSDDDSEDEDE